MGKDEQERVDEVRLAAILDREAGATAGPWYPMGDPNGTEEYERMNVGYVAMGCGYGPFLAGAPMKHEDAVFVSCARSDVPDLAFDLRDARQRIEELENLREGWHKRALATDETTTRLEAERAAAIRRAEEERVRAAWLERGLEHVQTVLRCSGGRERDASTLHEIRCYVQERLHPACTSET